MKSTISHVVILLLLGCSTISIAQEEKETKPVKRLYTNSVKFLFGDFFIQGTEHIGRPITQLGLYYERQVYKGFYAGIGYMQWTPLFTPNSVMSTLELEEPRYTPVVGKVRFIRDYKMIDVYAFYKLRIRNSNHYFNGGVGLSYAWGIDQYLSSHYTYLWEEHSTYERRRNNYYGFTPSISYDYLLMNNRFSIGGDIRARYYTERAKAQYDYGLHLGVNF